MYVGYVSRYEERKEKRFRKSIGVLGAVIIAFIMGCIVMQAVMLLDSPADVTLLPELFHITGEKNGIPGGMPSDGAGSVSAGDILLGEVQTNEVVYEEEIVPENALQKENLFHEEQNDTKLVVIDAGHGGEDEGCSRDGVLEKEINLTLALALRDKLEERGFEVLLTREDDISLSLEERVEIANTSKGDFLISIHQNAWEESDVKGIETWYNGQTAVGEESERLARLVQQRVILYTEANDRGIMENEDLVVVREAAMPACLVETGFLSNVAERELLLTENYQEQIVKGLADAVQLYFFPRTMYLTFDDGPTAENTNAILDILKEKDVKATFFVIGANVEKHPEVAKRIVEEGHTIGIHCNWHDYDMLYESVEGYVEDFEQAQRTVYEVTGVEATLFRFPGGSINAYNKDVYEDIIEEMTNRGYIYFDWNASLEDAVSKPEPERLLQNAKESTLGRKKIIMLAHDSVHSTAVCLEELIDQFPEYKMEPLTQDVEPIQF